MAERGVTILQNPFVIEFILPFILLFSVIFAVLQKSEVLGKSKKQIDAMVAFAMALIFVAFSQAVGIVIQMTVFLGIGLGIFLVLMILVGMVNPGGFDKAFSRNFSKWASIVAIIAVVIAAAIFTGLWDWIYTQFIVGGEGEILTNIFAIVIIAAAIGFVLWGAKGESKKE